LRDIYYIEDDQNIAQIVAEYLEQRAFSVTIFSTIAQARRGLQKQKPDMCLVDWNMPDGQGDMLCRFIRSRWSDLPVIFLTVRGDAADIVAGFQYGADDYVVKPFELEVLYSRILALLRRAGNVSDQVLSCGSISINESRMAVFCGDDEIVVSQAEYQLLLILLRNKGKTVRREKLLQEVWDSSGSYVNDNTLTVTMKRLREKLHQPLCLKTIRSFGYRMEETE
jgi:DNA-binding response OmpR family regulator